VRSLGVEDSSASVDIAAPYAGEAKTFELMQAFPALCEVFYADAGYENLRGYRPRSIAARRPASTNATCSAASEALE